jgi:hypothetical protein
VAAIGSTVCVYAGETVVPIPSEAFGGSSTEMRRFIDVARERSGAGAGDHDTESAGPDAARG